MENTTLYKIRFSDCDSFKHLHNSAYIDYMLNAREDHLKEFHQIDMTQLYQKGSGWMVNRHDIIYLSPASYNEKIRIQSDLVKMTNDSLLVEMLMWNEAKLQLKAILYTKFIHIDLQTGKRANHADWFTAIAQTLERRELQQFNSINERLSYLLKKITLP